MRGLKWAIAGIAAAAFIVLLLLPAPTDEPAGRPAATGTAGDASPIDGGGPEAFTTRFELLSGAGSVSLADLRGEPVVVNFWASWCAPCREEARLLQATFERYEERGVRFLGVNIRDTPTAAAEFVEEFGITYPIARDPEQILATELEVVGLPVTYFIDHRGVPVGSEAGAELGDSGGTVVLGAISKVDLVAAIESLLENMEAGR